MGGMGFFAPVVLFLLVVFGQVYWTWRIDRVLSQWLPRRAKMAVSLVLVTAYLFSILYNIDELFVFPQFGPQANPTRLGFTDAFLTLTEWWLLTSTLAFVLVIPVAIVRGMLRAAGLRPSHRKQAARVPAANAAPF